MSIPPCVNTIIKRHVSLQTIDAVLHSSDLSDQTLNYRVHGLECGVRIVESASRLLESNKSRVVSVVVRYT